MTSPAVSDGVRVRMNLLALVVTSLFVALLARLWYLQVMASHTYQVRAQQNQVRVVYTQAPRGRILDRNGNVLVDNRPQRQVTVDRKVLAAMSDDDQGRVLARLSELVGEPVADIREALKDERRSAYQSVPIASDVDDTVIVRVREAIARGELGQPGGSAVEAAAVAVRQYVEFGQVTKAPIAAHYLGYVGGIYKEEMAGLGSGYQLGDEIGKTGVEKAFEADLRGRPEQVTKEVNRQGLVISSKVTRRGLPGHDVVLTLDRDVQRVAEEALDQGLTAARRRRSADTGGFYPAVAGSVVVLDVVDGSVVAMASNPTFDLRSFVNGISSADYARLVDPAQHFPLNNRTTQGLYAPGSTFKLFTALAGTSKGLITPGTTVVDNGKIQIGNRVFRNAGTRAYGPVDLAESLVVSSDVYYYVIGRDFWQQRRAYGEEAIQEVARAYGLGQRSNIGLGGELAGRIPTPTLRREQFDKYPGKFMERNWFEGDNVNMSIGQGEVAITPLQLALAYATFANGGTPYQPRLAKEIRDAETGEVLRHERIVPKPPVAIDPAVRASIVAGLSGVTSAEMGTASVAFAGFPLSTYPVAGKTGTAQVGSRARPKEDTALFVGFAPANQPRYVVAVVMEESGFGGSTAAPVARRVFEVLAQQAGVEVGDTAVDFVEGRE